MVRTEKRKGISVNAAKGFLTSNGQFYTNKHDATIAEFGLFMVETYGNNRFTTDVIEVLTNHPEEVRTLLDALATKTSMSIEDLSNASDS